MANPLPKVQKLNRTIKPKLERIQNDVKSARLSFRNAGSSNYSRASDAIKWRNPILDHVMEALSHPHNHIIRVYASADEMTNTLFQRVQRRVDRDMLFDVVVTASVTNKPDVKKIQEDIATQLGFIFEEKSKDKRAIELLHRIKNEHRNVLMLCDVYEGFDLGKIGIPFGANHEGCKVLLSSTSEDVLIKQMHSQKIFKL